MMIGCVNCASIPFGRYATLTWSTIGARSPNEFDVRIGDMTQIPSRDVPSSTSTDGLAKAEMPRRRNLYLYLPSK